MLTLWQVVESPARTQQVEARPSPSAPGLPLREGWACGCRTHWFAGGHRPSVPLHLGGFLSKAWPSAMPWPVLGSGLSDRRSQS